MNAKTILIAVLGSLLFLSGCNSMPSDVMMAQMKSDGLHQMRGIAAQAPKRDLSVAEKKAAMTAVKAQLKDPDSAKFRFARYTENPSKIYCGFVNAKNSYGGYSGEVPFQVMFLESKHPQAVMVGVGSLGANSYESRAVTESCADNGYTFGD